MIQQINTGRADIPSSGRIASDQSQNPEEFRSALQAASNASADSEKKTADVHSASSSEQSLKELTKKQNKETDEFDQNRASTGQVLQSTLQPAMSLLSNESALFVSAPTVQAEQSPEESSPAAAEQDGIASVSNSAAEHSPQTVHEYVLGDNVLVSAPVLDSRQKAAATKEIQSAVLQDGNMQQHAASVPAGLESQELQKPDFKALKADEQPLNQQQTSSNADDRKAASAASAASPSLIHAAEQSEHTLAVQTGVMQKKPSDSTEFSVDGADVFNSGVTDLYGSGKVVIKVSGETASEKASPAMQVGKMALHQLQNGKTEFQMDLYPKSLGKVSVKLTSQDGLLTVEIAAADPKTQSLLLSGSSEIRSILQVCTGQNVQTLVPEQQVQQWYGQPQDDGGNSENQRQKQEEPRKNHQDKVGSVSTDLSAGDFLAMIQRIGVLAG
ncbi:MAG: flagellar hook-length control protein FliK [Oscillospiraceae bacterium]|nr:flagellar hook-length control protein FliK [Oscillospiraceae bacterium]